MDPEHWIERDAAEVWHGFTQMAAYADNSQVIVERAEGRDLAPPLASPRVAQAPRPH